MVARAFMYILAAQVASPCTRACTWVRVRLYGLRGLYERAYALEGYQLTVNSELARFRESDCLIKTKHCDGPRGC